MINNLEELQEYCDKTITVSGWFKKGKTAFINGIKVLLPLSKEEINKIMGEKYVEKN